MTVLVGIDVGTSKVGVGVYDSEGRLLARGEGRVREQTASGWIEALRAATPRRLLASRAGEEVIVSAAGTSGTIVLVDSRGNPVHRPLMYYERSEEGHRILASSGAARLAGEAGIDHGPSSTLAKLAFLASRGILERARWILPQATWILYRLVYREGEEWAGVATDFNNALKFGAHVLSDKPHWMEDVLGAIGVPLEKMPGIVGCGSEAGRASSRLAEELGLKGAHVHHGTTDGNASALASGVLGEGDFGIYTGTTTVAKRVVGEPVKAEGIYYHRHPLEGFLASAATAETGGFLSWFAETVAGVSVGEALEAASRIEPGREPIFYPPGYRGPFNDPRAMAALAGIEPRASSRPEAIGYIARGIMVGVVMVEAYYVELFEKLYGRGIGVVKLSGGTARSRLWNTLRSSVYGKRVAVYGEDVTLGTLIPAIVRRGLATPGEVGERLVKPLEVLDPDSKLRDKYSRLRRSFMEGWRRVIESYKAYE